MMIWRALDRRQLGALLAKAADALIHTPARLADEIAGPSGQGREQYPATPPRGLRVRAAPGITTGKAPLRP
ncbi:MAG: hypothetical protein JNM75_06230 [Rhodospirillales bacterium]|nr:hypothetical protein [Rhodospirillales bacterium]